MKNLKIITSGIVVKACIVSIYPLFGRDMKNYSSGMATGYYTVNLWTAWIITSLIFLVPLLLFRKYRKQWRFVLLNFSFVVLIVGGMTLKLILENRIDQAEKSKKLINNHKTR